MSFPQTRVTIYDPVGGPIVTPKAIYINGVEVLVAADGLEVSPPVPDEAMTVTLTLIPSSIEIGSVKPEAPVSFRDLEDELRFALGLPVRVS